MASKFYILPILSFAIAFLVIPVLRKIAFRIQLVDKPNQRKVHTSAVPLVGGIGIFFASSLAAILAIPSFVNLLDFKNIFISSFIIFIMGVIDDRFNLKATLKLIIQLLLAHFIYESGIKIESLHGLFGIYELSDFVQYGLTIITITGVVNAFNLMDGIDGLAAGLSLIGFSMFTILAFITGQETLTCILVSLLGATFAFLRFNLSKEHKIFMGDAGSLMVGFILAVAGIKLLQAAEGTLHASFVMLSVIAVLIIPVLDALRVFRNRMKAGKSPFSADRTHLHHLVISTGLKHRLASSSILLFMVSLLVVGYFVYQLKGLTISIVLLLVIFFTITSLLQFNDTIKAWKRKILVIEGR